MSQTSTAADLTPEGPAGKKTQHRPAPKHSICWSYAYAVFFGKCLLHVLPHFCGVICVNVGEVSNLKFRLGLLFHCTIPCRRLFLSEFTENTIKTLTFFPARLWSVSVYLGCFFCCLTFGICIWFHLLCSSVTLCDEHNGAAKETDISLRSWWRPKTELKGDRTVDWHSPHDRRENRKQENKISF